MTGSEASVGRAKHSPVPSANKSGIRIAIQPDGMIHRNGERQSYSERWTELAQAEGVSVVPVDVFADDIIPRIAGCDAFMWRCPPSAHPRLYAKRLLPAIEHGLGIPVFPSLPTGWHFEDKLAQYYLLALAGIPTPSTQVLWDRRQAKAFCVQAGYPFVLKLSAGYQATNVRMVHSPHDALFYVDELFGAGLVSLRPASVGGPRRFFRRLRAAVNLAGGRHQNRPNSEAELHHGYFYAQEFLPGNTFDTRVTVIGKRAFAFRRFNRPGDFRASGSGRIDWNPDAIAKDAVRLAYRVADQLGTQTVAIDVLRRGAEPVVGELTLSYASWAIRDCPGHWVLTGDPQSGRLEWSKGQTLAEDAIFSDFLACVRRSVARSADDCPAPVLGASLSRPDSGQ